MTRRRRLTRSAAVCTAIAALIPALAATSATAATPMASQNVAGSATGTLVATLAYRGAEHPYLVGNLADAGKRFGPNSAQAKAAAAALAVNKNAIAQRLSGGSATKAQVRAALDARDTAEVAYAAAVVAAHRAGVSGTTAAETEALAAVAAGTVRLADAVHATVPAVSVAAAEKGLTTLSAGDEKTLRAAALNEPAQFADVEAGSVSLGSLLAGVGQAKAANATASSRPVEARAALEVAFTEHVYQTGLFGEAVLVFGPKSAAATAAHAADNANTVLVSVLLRDLGSGANTQKVWNSHITGYDDYLTHLATGGSSVAAADTLFASYESGIAADVHHADPALSTTMLKTMLTMHVTGTLVVFHLEKAGSPALYPTALGGAAMLASFGGEIAATKVFPATG
jgi:hypothetical protein